MPERRPAAGTPAAPLVLASASPQRRAILERLGVRFIVHPTRARERVRGEPEQVALENARRKARAAAAAHPGRMVLACDTVVSLEGKLYGKPRDERRARRTLEALSGATHEVVSALVLRDGGERTASAHTRVRFRALDESLLSWYLARGEWRDRAGAYAIQGAGAALVRCVQGDYENVVGLPLAALLDLCPQLLAVPAKVRTYRKLRGVR